MWDEQGWEQWYAARDEAWVGRPNGWLVEVAGGLAPGRVLDAGCGEGADALWLAERGWQVLAVDFSASALRRGKARAARLERAVAARVMWMRADVLTWSGLDVAREPASGRASRFEVRFDLVSAQFLRVPAERRAALLARLAGVVAPGGSLLVVGDDPVGAGDAAGAAAAVSELAGWLDPSGWEVLVARGCPRPRAEPTADGSRGLVHDGVLQARRRAS